MGWGRLMLLGNFGQQLDIQDREREINQLRSNLDGQFARDADQDEQIRTLRQHNQELQLYMTAVVRLLVTKGVLSEAEIHEMVQLVEKTEPRR